MVLAGILLDHIKTSIVFMNVPEIFILLPALLGLKGNLEMTMTSRLSSLANCGQLNNKNRLLIFRSNIALVQCQSIVIGFAAALFALLADLLYSSYSNIFIGNYYNRSIAFNYNHIPMLCATSIITASLTSLLLATIMITVICWTVKHDINPDNVATPIAAALGDLVTLAILYSIASIFYSIMDEWWFILVAIVIISLLLVNWLAKEARAHLSTGSSLGIKCWIPMFMAMFISSLSGFILSYSVIRFDDIAAYQPLVNGVGGNIAAIQASRLSSNLHMIRTFNQRDSRKKLSSLVKRFDGQNMLAFLTGNDVHSISAQTLLSVVIPFHLIFFVLLNQFNGYQHPAKNVWLFLFLYLISTFTQVFILLFLTGIIIMKLWKYGLNPDDSSIPYLTAFGDLFGTILLTIAFYSYEYLLKLL
ncbi:solute carrier family 41 member 1-like [Dermatophagoides farinae]|nr:solute carrier family 41 member 1-like [Dermatophagoides farinae]